MPSSSSKFECMKHNAYACFTELLLLKQLEVLQLVTPMPLKIWVPPSPVVAFNVFESKTQKLAEKFCA